MSDYINMTLSSFSDENGKLLTRSELFNRVCLKDEKIEKLKTQLEKAEVAIEYYANTGNWRKNHQICFGLIDRSDQWNGYQRIGGKRAREYFKEKEANG